MTHLRCQCPAERDIRLHQNSLITRLVDRNAHEGRARKYIKTALAGGEDANRDVTREAASLCRTVCG